MSAGTDRRREGAMEWARLRQRYAKEGSPCQSCRLDACPPICYRRREWNRKRGVEV